MGGVSSAPKALRFWRGSSEHLGERPVCPLGTSVAFPPCVFARISAPVCPTTGQDTPSTPTDMSNESHHRLGRTNAPFEHQEHRELSSTAIGVGVPMPSGQRDGAMARSWAATVGFFGYVLGTVVLAFASSFSEPSSLAFHPATRVAIVEGPDRKGEHRDRTVAAVAPRMDISHAHPTSISRPPRSASSSDPKGDDLSLATTLAGSQAHVEEIRPAGAPARAEPGSGHHRTRRRHHSKRPKRPGHRSSERSGHHSGHHSGS